MEKCQKPRRAPNLDLKKARGSESLGETIFGYYSRLFRHNDFFLAQLQRIVASDLNLTVFARGCFRNLNIG
jgi:hypothetical protein